MLKLTIRPKAQFDIDDIIDYLLSERPANAEDFVSDLQRTFDSLVDNPKIGVKRTYRAPALNQMRMFPLKQFSAYLVFYIADDDTLDIVRVIHGSKDIVNLFETENL